MDEFGETPTFYIWPKDHEPGHPMPTDFIERMSAALDEAGLEWETV